MKCDLRKDVNAKSNSAEIGLIVSDSMTRQFEGTKKSLPKYIAKEKVDELLNKVRGTSTKDYLILLTLFRTGMRSSELVHLTKRDISQGEVTIRQGKGRKDRLIPIDDGLYDLLMLHSNNLNLEDRLFPVTTARIRQVCYKYDKELHPHALRHSYAVFCLKQGMNLRALQKILGHSELSTTAIYLDLIGQDLKDEHKKVSW